MSSFAMKWNFSRLASVSVERYPVPALLPRRFFALMPIADVVQQHERAEPSGVAPPWLRCWPLHRPSGLLLSGSPAKANVLCSAPTLRTQPPAYSASPFDDDHAPPAAC